MRIVKFSTKARKELLEAWLEIAVDNEDAADEVEAAVISNASLLASYPDMGRMAKSHQGKLVRIWPAQPFPNYLIVYRATKSKLEILHIAHAKRRRSWEIL